jgi:hypothetical protein
MALEIVTGPGTEPLSEEVVDAVRSALGARTEAGPWKLTLERCAGGILVDLTNGNGTMKQWLFEAGDPISFIIQEKLRQ